MGDGGDEDDAGDDLVEFDVVVVRERSVQYTRTQPIYLFIYL